MTFTESQIDQVREEVRSNTFDFYEKLEKFAKDKDLIVPKEELVKFYAHRSAGGVIHVPKPSNLLTYFLEKIREGASLTDDNLAVTAEWLFNEDLGYPLWYFQNEPDSRHIERYEFDLIEFAMEVLNYQVGLDFPKFDWPITYDITFEEALNVSDEAFELAFSTELEPRYANSHEIEYIVPLNSFAYTKHPVPFEFRNTTYEVGPYEIELISDVQLKELSRAQKGGLRTQFRDRPTDAPGPDAPPSPGYNYTLNITVDVEDRSRPVTVLTNINPRAMEVISELADTVVTALRLFHPEMEVHKGNIYELQNNWHSETLDIAKIGSTRWSPLKALAGPWWSYRLDVFELDALDTFWNEYHTTFQDTTDQLENSLRRFNQSYQKYSHEDRVLDYFIGLESSLLRGRVTNYSIRLPARAAILLSEESYYANDYIYHFFDMVREIRNNIVHNDANIENWLKSVNFSENRVPINTEPDITSRDLVFRLRYFLAEILLTYIDIQKSTGIGVQEMNDNHLEPNMKGLLMNMD